MTNRARRAAAWVLGRLDERMVLHHASLRAGRPRFPDPNRFAAHSSSSVLVPPVDLVRPEHMWIGERVQILEGLWATVADAGEGIEPRLVVGDGTSIGRFARLACTDEIEFGSDVLTAQGIFVGDPLAAVDPDAPARRGPIHIGSSAFIGSHCAVLPGVTVGEHAYVGAGSVVTADVEPFTVMVGNPARPVRRYDPISGEWHRIRS